MAHVIREISIKDVENFIDLLSKIYDESEFTFYNPGEYSPSIASASQNLENYITSPSKAIYVAESDEQLVDTPLSIPKHTNERNMKLSSISVLKVLSKTWCRPSVN